jgi:hypothetical protein
MQDIIVFVLNFSFGCILNAILVIICNLPVPWAALITILVLGTRMIVKSMYTKSELDDSADKSDEEIKSTWQDAISTNYVVFLLYFICGSMFNAILVVTCGLSKAWTALLTLLLLAIITVMMLNPMKNMLDKNVDNTKSDLDAFADKSDDFNEQLTLTWQNAVAGRNAYYIVMFMILLYVPILCYSTYIISVPSPIPIATLLSDIMPYVVSIVFIVYAVAIAVWFMITWVWIVLGLILVGIAVGLYIMHSQSATSI